MSIRAEDVNIHPTWREALRHEFEQPYFAAIKAFLQSEIQAGKTIYPKGKDIFKAFDTTPFGEVKVVILGQDPYHNPGEAMGLSFSVPKGKRVPPSLQNIYKEIHSDLGLPIPNHGDLTHWAEQGVLLLNAMLTVEHGNAGSHKKIGWQTFTDAVIQTLSEHSEGLVFMLWGNFAKSKKVFIDETKHYVLDAPHPSPLARGFNGNKHFSTANELLEKQGKRPIDWAV